MKNLSLLLITIFPLSFVYAQDNDLPEDFISTATKKQLVQRNTEAILNNRYDQSITIANKLLGMDPENLNFQFRKGLGLFNSIFHSPSEAIPYFEKAATGTKKNFDFFSTSEKKSPTVVFFYLARCYHLTDNIDKAKENYQIFLDSKSRDPELIAQTNLYMVQCDNAKEYMKNSSNYKIDNLSDNINSKYADYSPVISLDGTTLFFTSRRLRLDSLNLDYKEPGTTLYLEDVYRALRTDFDGWEEAELMTFSRLDRNEASVYMAPDGRTVYFYKDDEGNGDIYTSKFEQKGYGELKPLDIKGVNTDAWEPHIAFSADGQYGYFTSDREGGYGGRDIYRITKLPDGKWSEPSNLGPTINTEYDEDGPFIAVDNTTLYFASNGKNSMGGFDIFVSVLDPNTQQWSSPINLGYPLNSTGDDIYFTSIADGTVGYYTSYREGGIGEKDIYRVEAENLKVNNAKVLLGNVSTSNGEPLLFEDFLITLNCKNCGDEQLKTREIYLRPEDGGFFSTLDPCRDYEMIVTQKGEELQRETFNTECEKGYQEIKKDIVIQIEEVETAIGELDINGKVIARNNENIPDDVVFKIRCLDCEDNNEAIITPFDKNSGDYASKLQPCHEYEVTFDKGGEVFYKETFRTDCEPEEPTVKKDFILDLEFIHAGNFLPFGIKHYFGYNNNEVDPNNGHLKELFDIMHDQVKKGRKEFILYVDASASKVTTSKFKNNMELAQTRANNIVKILNNHINTFSDIKGKVTIKIRDVSVNGPEYQRGMQTEVKKYIPYQFVVIELSGSNINDLPTNLQQSKDAEIKD
ncbi:MAG: PD40 domain-containing protein [Brumimicrobium sp.]|nr:PD40 domain-containing protein [Brumimicrobium sp.]